MTLNFPIARPLTFSSNGPAVRIFPLGFLFVDAAGQIVTRKSVTAFTLPKRFATGMESDALRYLDWASVRGFNEGRIFSRVDWAGPPNSGVETGWQYNEIACHRALVEAEARGMRLEVVAHTGKYGNVQQMAAHVKEVDELCLAHDNALLSLYNEPQQNGGNDLVEQLLNFYEPRTPGWVTGVYDPTPYTTIVQTGVTAEGRPIYAATSHARVGKAMTYHSPRKDEWSRCTKDAYEFSTGQGPYAQFSPGFSGGVLLDEPPQVEQTIRDYPHLNPADDWRAYGAGSKLWGCGGTMHSNPTLQKCEIPTDQTVLACIDAFIAGFSDVPTQRYHGYHRGDPPGTDPGSRRYYRWGDDSLRYELCVRPYSFKQA